MLEGLTPALQLFVFTRAAIAKPEDFTNFPV